MVQGEMVLFKGFRFGTLYKLQGSNISDGSNSFFFLRLDLNKSLLRKYYVVAPKSVEYWREGTLSTIR
jgi:hypothetical protein